MADEIHQLYFTHCTYRTSWQHQREDGIADQSFEYSTRAASPGIPREQSHEYFCKVERYLYYELPGDSPAGEELKRSANDTLPRMVFHPAQAGCRFLAVISYRRTDTQGRPGSYFAHVLLDEKDTSSEKPSLGYSPHGPPPPGTALPSGPGRPTPPQAAPQPTGKFTAKDCLKLWGASAWTHEDPEGVSEGLKSLHDLQQFRADEPELINDDVLTRFLTTEPGENAFQSEREVIPERWDKTTKTQRQSLLAETLQGFLELDYSKRQTMLVAIEPSMAALLFYGVARLLPQHAFAEHLSFSTLESHTSRPRTSLAATYFHNADVPEDLPSDAYDPKRRGYAVHTWNWLAGTDKEPAWKTVGNPPKYGADIVAVFIKDPNLADQFLHQVDATKAKQFRSRDLEKRLKTWRQTRKLLTPGAPVTFPPSAHSDAEFQQALAESLAALSDAQLGKFNEDGESPRRLAILEVVATHDQIAGHVKPAVERLLAAIAEEADETHLIALLESQRVAPPHKLFALARFVAEKNYLPGGHESLLEGQPSDNAENTPSLTTLLLQLGPAKSAEFLQANFQGGNPLDSLDGPPRPSLKKFRHILMSVEQVQKSDSNFEHVFQSVVESVCQNDAQRNVLRGFVFGSKTSDSQRKRFLRAAGRNSALLQLLRDELAQLHSADSAAEFRRKLSALQDALQCKFWPPSSPTAERIEALGNFADRQNLLQRAVAGERDAGTAFASIAEAAFPPNSYTATTPTELAELRATDVLALSSTLQAPQELPRELHSAFVEYFERHQWNYALEPSPASTPQQPPPPPPVPSRMPTVEHVPENEEQVAEKQTPLARAIEAVGNHLLPISATLMAIILLVLILMFFPGEDSPQDSQDSVASNSTQKNKVSPDTKNMNGQKDKSPKAKATTQPDADHKTDKKDTDPKEVDEALLAQAKAQLENVAWKSEIDSVLADPKNMELQKSLLADITKIVEGDLKEIEVALGIAENMRDSARESVRSMLSGEVKANQIHEVANRLVANSDQRVPDQASISFQGRDANNLPNLPSIVSLRKTVVEKALGSTNSGGATNALSLSRISEENQAKLMDLVPNQRIEDAIMEWMGAEKNARWKACVTNAYFPLAEERINGSLIQAQDRKRLSEKPSLENMNQFIGYWDIKANLKSDSNAKVTWDRKLPVDTTRIILHGLLETTRTSISRIPGWKRREHGNSGSPYLKVGNPIEEGSPSVQVEAWLPGDQYYVFVKFEISNGHLSATFPDPERLSKETEGRRSIIGEIVSNCVIEAIANDGSYWIALHAAPQQFQKPIKLTGPSLELDGLGETFFKLTGFSCGQTRITTGGATYYQGIPGQPKNPSVPGKTKLFEEKFDITKVYGKATVVRYFLKLVVVGSSQGVTLEFSFEPQRTLKKISEDIQRVKEKIEQTKTDLMLAAAEETRHKELTLLWGITKTKPIDIKNPDVLKAQLEEMKQKINKMQQERVSNVSQLEGEKELVEAVMKSDRTLHVQLFRTVKAGKRTIPIPMVLIGSPFESETDQSSKAPSTDSGA